MDIKIKDKDVNKLEQYADSLFDSPIELTAAVFILLRINKAIDLSLIIDTFRELEKTVQIHSVSN